MRFPEKYSRCAYRHLTVTALAAFLGLLPALFTAGCGSSSSSPSAAEPVTKISGTVYAGKTAGAQVSVYNHLGAKVAGPATTNAQGDFNLSLRTALLSGDLRIKATGGTFTDEATGAATPGGALSAFLPAASLSEGAKVALTPATTILDGSMANGMTMVDALTAFSQAFGFSPDSSIIPAEAPGDGISDAQLLEGFRAGAFSKLSAALGVAPSDQFSVYAALGEDLADGTLDGLTLGGPTVLFGGDVQNRFERASAAWLADGANITGLTSDKIGALPFSKIALTDSYTVTYIPGMMAAAQGRTQFKIKVQNRSDASPVLGLSGAGELKLSPLMHMAQMSHASPQDTAITDNGDGTYTCVLYYLMASSMGGVSMGFWELGVTVGPGAGETATFYPPVGMAMGSNTVRATLKGQSDMTGGMAGASKRTYYLFRDSLSGTPGDNTFKVFIAAGESLMSYPALYEGQSLHDQTGVAYGVSTVLAEASTNTTDWVPGTMEGQGHYAFAGLTGLLAGTQGTVYVRLSVNGERKTTDGNEEAGANGYASFTVVP